MLLLRNILSIFLSREMSSDASSLQTSPHIRRLLDIEGLDGKANDIIYHPSKDNKQPLNKVVFFGGDVQDYPENMMAHRDNKRHLRWNLENTTSLLHSHFPYSAIYVIRPSRMHLKTFSCYENFVSGNDVGAPKHQFSTECLKHLKILLQNAESKRENLMMQEHSKSCSSIEDTSVSLSGAEKTCSAIGHDIPLILIGFSKGCVVLNQLLHSFQVLETSSDIELENFQKRIKAMYWLDGGHSGGSNTWMTNKSLLQVLVRSGIHVKIHVTPYQMHCDLRPWIGKEEKIFRETLKKMGANVERTLHFTDEPRSLENHFRVLEAFADAET